MLCTIRQKKRGYYRMTTEQTRFGFRPNRKQTLGASVCVCVCSFWKRTVFWEIENMVVKKKTYTKFAVESDNDKKKKVFPPLLYKALLIQYNWREEFYLLHRYIGIHPLVHIPTSSSHTKGSPAAVTGLLRWYLPSVCTSSWTCTLNVQALNWATTADKARVLHR